MRLIYMEQFAHTGILGGESATYLALAKICLHQWPELLQRKIVPASRKQRYQVLQTLNQVQCIALRKNMGPKPLLQRPGRQQV